jgi:hypothetical protein
MLKKQSINNSPILTFVRLLTYNILNNVLALSLTYLGTDIDFLKSIILTRRKEGWPEMKAELQK